jgi:hypothetical protein
MVFLTCVAKAIGVTTATVVTALLADLLLVRLGVPVALLYLVWAVALGGFAGFFARDHLESEHPGYWALGGVLFGLLILPFLVFAYEWNQANQRASDGAVGAPFGGPAGLEPPRGLPSAEYWSR